MWAWGRHLCHPSSPDWRALGERPYENDLAGAIDEQ